MTDTQLPDAPETQVYEGDNAARAAPIPGTPTQAGAH
jgi:hypothetical protein